INKLQSPQTKLHLHTKSPSTTSLPLSKQNHQNVHRRPRLHPRSPEHRQNPPQDLLPDLLSNLLRGAHPGQPLHRLGREEAQEEAQHLLFLQARQDHWQRHPDKGPLPALPADSPYYPLKRNNPSNSKLSND
ncbi:hypothetical protein TRIATDRAFT_299161, partial [Trichoderma atroviride IMI 206040]